MDRSYPETGIEDYLPNLVMSGLVFAMTDLAI